MKEYVGLEKAEKHVDIVDTGLRSYLYKSVRALWLTLREALVAVLGEEGLDQLLWRLGFFHAKSRWLRYEWKAPDGINYLLRPEDKVIAGEAYEIGIFAFCKIPKDAVVVDCGAHIGLFTLYLQGSQGHTKGRTIALEPSLLTREVLEANLARNNANSVTVHPWAISDRSKTLELFFTGSYGGDYCKTPVISDPAHIRNQVKAVSLDELFKLEGITHCDLLKIDIEGSELDALHGATEALKVTQTMMMEIHKLVVTADQVTSILDAAGFQWKLYYETDHIVLLYAWRGSAP